MMLFQTISPPAGRSRNRICQYADWWTWSDEFRKEIPKLLREAERLCLEPRIAHIPGLRKYDYTFSLLHQPVGFQWAEILSPWARALQRVSPEGRIVLMRDLISQDMTSLQLRTLFAGLRDALTPNLADPHGVLYAPLGDVGGEPTEFPLHCDLYLPQRLWNVFDDVSTSDRLGASVFLETQVMLELAVQSGVDASDVEQLKSCLKVGIHDRYDEFYRLLYGNKPGFEQLNRLMRQRCCRIRLQRGEAYLIADRVWMHGRTLTARTVTENRLHRLIF